MPSHKTTPADPLEAVIRWMFYASALSFCCVHFSVDGVIRQAQKSVQPLGSLSYLATCHGWLGRFYLSEDRIPRFESTTSHHVKSQSTMTATESSTPLELSPELQARYQGHKVVTLPSTRNRQRSMSAGRQRSRDLVREIYDKIGVERDPPAATAPVAAAPESPAQQQNHQQGQPFSERYRLAAARGRGREQTDERTPRSRSLGRVSQRWPPTQSEGPGSPKKRGLPASPNRSKTPTSPNRVAAPPSPARSSPGISHSRSFDGRPTSRTDSIEGLSVRDRISVLSRAQSRRRSVDPQYAASFAVRERPPKVDIFEEKKHDAEDKLEPSPSDEKKEPPVVLTPELERYIEERIAAQVALLEARLEAKFMMEREI